MTVVVAYEIPLRPRRPPGGTDPDPRFLPPVPLAAPGNEHLRRGSEVAPTMVPAEAVIIRTYFGVFGPRYSG